MKVIDALVAFSMVVVVLVVVVVVLVVVVVYKLTSRILTCSRAMLKYNANAFLTGGPMSSADGTSGIFKLRAADMLFNFWPLIFTKTCNPDSRGELPLSRLKQM